MQPHLGSVLGSRPRRCPPTGQLLFKAISTSRDTTASPRPPRSCGSPGQSIIRTLPKPPRNATINARSRLPPPRPLARFAARCSPRQHYCKPEVPPNYFFVVFSFSRFLACPPCPQPLAPPLSCPTDASRPHLSIPTPSPCAHHDDEDVLLCLGRGCPLCPRRGGAAGIPEHARSAPTARRALAD